ncbi:hypothetical protein SapgrDRAFT_1084 [Saprospira grandis DSM 2844]|uniref:Uncharacterized protein n=1 Tax=Saprospira grandis DSM 2844 TaxID=694433 RepID=J0NZ56_9BACT|nr:hypothetical protein SapgrDRAFT_1084 [Saprospira grandis DSM 2844]
MPFSCSKILMIKINKVFWGLRLPSVVGATLQGSQVCSALRRFAPWSAAAPPPFASLGQMQVLRFGHFGPTSLRL